MKEKKQIKTVAEVTEKKKQNKCRNDEKISGNRLTAMCGVFTALAMLLSYLESLIPVFVAVPGVKLGLANLVTIVALKKLGLKPTIIISFCRIILSGLLFSNPAVIIYSLAGAFLSILVMVLVDRVKFFSVTGVSICGACAHNLGQIVVAMIVLENVNIMYYMVVLGLTGAISGTIIGIVAGNIIKQINISSRR